MALAPIPGKDLIGQLREFERLANERGSTDSRRYEAVDAIHRIAESAADAPTRSEAVKTLGRLVDADRDTFPYTQQYAARVIARSTSAGLAAQRRAFLLSPPTRHNSHWAILGELSGRTDTAAVRDVESVARTHPYVSLRTVAVQKLPHMGTDAHEILGDIARRDVNETIRGAALTAAAENKLPGVVGLLSAAAQNDLMGVVQTQAVALLADLAKQQHPGAFVALQQIAALELPIAAQARQTIYGLTT